MNNIKVYREIVDSIKTEYQKSVTDSYAIHELNTRITNINSYIHLAEYYQKRNNNIKAKVVLIKLKAAINDFAIWVGEKIGD